jgi:polyketide synthase 12
LASLEGLDGRVVVAAVNGPCSVVFSGDEDAVLELAGVWEGEGRSVKRLRVSHAFHSPRMDGMLEEFARVTESIEYHEPRIPIVSNVTGRVAEAGELSSAGYWVRHVREPVRFLDGMRCLGEQGVSKFLELGPDGVLSAMGLECLPDTPGDAPGSTGVGETSTSDSSVAVSVLRGGRGEVEALFCALAEVWVRGVGVDWAGVFKGSGARRVALPSYAFQRERFWLAPSVGDVGNVASVGLVAAGHPLLGAAVELPDGEWLFTGRLSLQSHSWLADHTVMGGVLLPGTAFVELVLRAGQEVGCDLLQELVLEAPLVIGEGGVQLQVSVGVPDEAGGRLVGIRSRPEPASGDGLLVDEGLWTSHASGVLAAAAQGDGRRVLEERARGLGGVWPPPEASPVDVDDLYDALAGVGLEYGPVFQGLQGVWRDGEDVFAEVVLPEGQREAAGGFGVHPALLDAALHALAVGLVGQGTGEDAGEGAAGGARLPFAWGGVRFYAVGASRLRVRLTPAGPEAVSLVLASEDGGLVASVGSLALREVSAEGLGGGGRGLRDSLFCLEWPLVSVGGDADGDLVVGGGLSGGCVVLGGDGCGLVGELVGCGVDVGVFGDVGSLRVAVEGGVVAPGVVFVDCTAGGGLVEGEGAVGEDVGVVGVARGVLGGVLGLVGEWLGDECFVGCRLVLVTCGGVAVGGGEGVGGVALSGVWGLVRSVQSEHPGRVVLVDVDMGAGGAGVDIGVGVGGVAVGGVAVGGWGGLLLGGLGLGESQLAVRGDGVHVPRLARVAEGALVVPGGGAWRLGVASRGTLESLVFVDSPGADGVLGVGEVRVAVRAAGVNFRDVLIALDLYPGDALLGGEAAGVVLEVGPGVEDLAPGDRVMGLISGAFGPVAVGDRRLFVRVPEGWSFADGAAIPTVFLTAFYGLLDLAGLKAGERVLVHAAAGGVGMAAVQLARYLGAEVFATASPGKWDALRALGLDDAHIASSRTLEFKDKFLDATGGRGVDVVLDSLAGEFVDASLELLPGGGRFIEMGKTDIRDPEEISAGYPGVAYRAFDVTEAGLERTQEMLLEILGLFEGGVLERSPVSVWDLRRAPEAFRFMSQARHIGKIVLKVPSPLDPQGTVLVTGGTGVLGALVARHLVVEYGVRRLLLVGRRGLDAEGAPELARELGELGADVEIVACDVADREQLKTLIQSVPAGAPLSGVVHAAGVLDDATIESLTIESLDRVLAPKLDAAWYLHELTEHLDLSMFVLFSSAAGTFGSPGQANYAAANAFLDALAAYRHARGLNATSMAWGLWQQASALTEGLSEEDLARFARGGVAGLSNEQGLALFDTASALGEPALVPIHLDLRALRAQADPGLIPPVLRNLIRAPARKASDSGSLTRRLASAPADQREQLILEAVRGEAAIVLGHASPTDIDSHQTFKDLGFDSLAAVELRNRLIAATGMTHPATVIFDYPTPTALANYLLDKTLPNTKTHSSTPEDEIRHALTTIPITRLRKAGLLETLLQLANSDEGVLSSADSDAIRQIDTLDIEGLVQRARETIAPDKRAS